MMRKMAATFASMLLVCSFYAGAEDAKTATAASAPASAAMPSSNLQKHNCTKLRPAPAKKFSNDRQLKEYTRDVDAYRNCLTTFGKEMFAIATQHNDAGNAALQEFNDFVKATNELK